MISKEWIRVADAAHFTAVHNNEGIIILQRVYLETIALGMCVKRLENKDEGLPM